MRKRIDPLTLLHQLEEAGFSRAQAEAQLRLVLMIIESRSPTIRHLRLVEVRLGSDMQQLEARLQSDAKALHRLSFLRFTDREYKVLTCVGYLSGRSGAFGAAAPENKSIYAALV